MSYRISKEENNITIQYISNMNPEKESNIYFQFQIFIF